ncbi:MAG: hypothetical protein O3B01_20790 [Planctomycetota bacterium]|nr:hypothetical protein [Planctomycetota bacterium]MDA1141011.1 hypothetical protein [Planctomycetota bacterium]
MNGKRTKIPPIVILAIILISSLTVIWVLVAILVVKSMKLAIIGGIVGAVFESAVLMAGIMLKRNL